MRGRLGNSGLGSANEHGLPHVNGIPALNGNIRNRLRKVHEKMIQPVRKPIQQTAEMIP
jgi:hypothetical protein